MEKQKSIKKEKEKTKKTDQIKGEKKKKNVGRNRHSFRLGRNKTKIEYFTYLIESYNCAS